MDLPQRAPAWAAPLVGALLDAGFLAGDEVRGGMAGYSLVLRRDDCNVVLGGDRGELDALLEFPALDGRPGRRRSVTMRAEDYMAAERGDPDAALLLSDRLVRERDVAGWLATRATDGAGIDLDDGLLERVRVLRRLRARALFDSR